MSIHVTDAVLVAQDEQHYRPSAAWEARAAFLARYRVPSTRTSYEIHLTQWFEWCNEQHLDPLDATRGHIEMFARELEMTGRCVATVAGKLGALGGFYRMAFLDGVIAKDPMEHVIRPKVPRVSTTNGLNRGEFADLLKVAETSTPRNHALICLLGLNGLRVSEACGIDVEHLGFYKGHRTATITRKGGNHQTVPFSPRTSWAIEAAMGDRTAGPLLLTHYDNRLTRNTANVVVKQLAREAGITKRLHPHSLRHTFVTLSLDANVSERDIMASTGHSDTRMISYYDRNRDSIARNATHALTAFVEGAG